MKVSIPLSDPVFRSAETLAASLRKSRSQLYADAPGNVRVSKFESGLSKPSVVNVSQMLTVDRELLTHRVKMLPGQVIARIGEGLRLALAL